MTAPTHRSATRFRDARRAARRYDFTAMNPVNRIPSDDPAPVIDWDHHAGRAVFTDLRNDRRSFSDTAAAVLDLHFDRTVDELLEILRRSATSATLWIEPSPGAVHAEFGPLGDEHPTRWWAKTDRQPDGRTRLRVVVAAKGSGRLGTQYRAAANRLSMLCTELGTAPELLSALAQLAIRPVTAAPAVISGGAAFPRVILGLAAVLLTAGTIALLTILT